MTTKRCTTKLSSQERHDQRIGRSPIRLGRTARSLERRVRGADARPICKERFRISAAARYAGAGGHCDWRDWIRAQHRSQGQRLRYFRSRFSRT